MTTIKVSPIPRNVTESEVRQTLGVQNSTRIVINGENAYLSLSDPAILERLAGVFGDNLKVDKWGATIEPLDNSFNFESLVPKVGSVRVPEVGEVLSEGLKASQNIIGNVVEGVKDIIGSGVSTQIGPTVNFTQYNQKLGNIVNILLAVWLVLFLN